MLLRRGVRSFADDAAAAAGGDASGEMSRRAFLEKFKPFVSSTTAPPCFPTDFLPKEEAAETAATAGVPDKLKFSFYLPHGQPVDRQPVRIVFWLLPSTAAAAAPSIAVAPRFSTTSGCSITPALFADACSRSCCCERGRDGVGERA